MTTRHVAVAGAIVAIAAGLALGGCRGGGAHPAGSSSPTAMSQAQLLALGHEYAQCIRQHGIPDFPDPVFRNGRLMMPAGDTTSKQKLTNNLGAQNACRSLAARLPQSGNHESQAPLSQAEVHKLMQWSSACASTECRLLTRISTATSGTCPTRGPPGCWPRWKPARSSGRMVGNEPRMSAEPRAGRR
jgi:hypothetical protein